MAPVAVSDNPATLRFRSTGGSHHAERIAGRRRTPLAIDFVERMRTRVYPARDSLDPPSTARLTGSALGAYDGASDFFPCWPDMSAYTSRSRP